MLSKFKQLIKGKNVLLIIGICLQWVFFVNVINSGSSSNGMNACECADVLNYSMYLKGSDKWKVSACTRAYGGALRASRACK